jgi:hypothetical protein
VDVEETIVRKRRCENISFIFVLHSFECLDLAKARSRLPSANAPF